jgi:hypothetical protein
MKRGHLPKIDTGEKYIKFLPYSGGLIKSSVCMNFKTIPLRFRNIYEETGQLKPSDGEFWRECSVYINNNKLKSYIVNKLTCVHETETYSFKKGKS